MKLNHVFLFQAITAFLYGVPMVLAPRWIADMFAAEEYGQIAVVMAQWFGAALVGFSVLTWLARGLTEEGGRRVIATALFIYAVIATVISILGQLAGVWLPLMWGTVVVILIIALGYGYYVLVKREFT
jgi:MFS family permease